MHMAKSLIELALELAEIVDKQRQLAAREAQIKVELQNYQAPQTDIARSRPDPMPTNGILAPPTNSAWNVNAKIDKKAASVLKRTKRIMTNREIGEEIVEIENNHDPEYIKFLVRKFSAVVGGKAKNKRTFNRIEIDGVLYYGLLDFFAPNGTVKAEYLPVE